MENIIHSPRKNTYVNISALPLIKNGKLIGVVSTERDVSEITNLSRELEFTKEKLVELCIKELKVNNRISTVIKNVREGCQGRQSPRWFTNSGNGYKKLF